MDGADNPQTTWVTTENAAVMMETGKSGAAGRRKAKKICFRHTESEFPEWPNRGDLR